MEFAQNITLLTATNWETLKIEVKVLMYYGALEFIENPNSCDESSKKTYSSKKAVLITDHSILREKNGVKLRKVLSYTNTLTYQTLSPDFKLLIALNTD